MHAFQLLRGRYEPTSASSGLMIFFSLLTFTMTQSLEKHILQFKDKLRELAPHQNWFLNPMQVCSIFLRSLSPKYRQWVQQKMTDADRDPTLLYTPELMYAQTMEWERTRLFASGEADNSGEALWVEASSKPTKTQRVSKQQKWSPSMQALAQRQVHVGQTMQISAPKPKGLKIEFGRRNKFKFRRRI